MNVNHWDDIKQTLAKARAVRHAEASGDPRAIREARIALEVQKTKTDALWANDVLLHNARVIVTYLTREVESVESLINEIENQWPTLFVEERGEVVPVWLGLASESAYQAVYKWLRLQGRKQALNEVLLHLAAKDRVRILPDGTFVERP